MRKTLEGEGSIWTKVDNMNRESMDTTYVYKPGLSGRVTNERLFKELDNHTEEKEPEQSDGNIALKLFLSVLIITIIVFALYVFSRFYL